MQQILSLVRRAVQEFDMIQAGEKVAIGVSGGKDSLLTLWALAQLRQFYPKQFTLEAITLDLGDSVAVPSHGDLSQVRAFCETLSIPYTVVKTDIFEVVFDIRKETNPCSLCAKMRRGALHDAAIKLGCRKVALGHHFDDAVETFMMSLLFEGRLGCFAPVTFLDRVGVTLLRPLLYVEEAQVRQAVKALQLPVVHNPCPANGNTKRQEVKELFVDMEKRYPALRQKVFGAMHRYPLRGWERPENTAVNSLD